MKGKRISAENDVIPKGGQAKKTIQTSWMSPVSEKNTIHSDSDKIDVKQNKAGLHVLLCSQLGGK